MNNTIYPPEKIINPIKKDFEFIILWMLSNNDSCGWSCFTNPPLEFRLSTLSKYLSILKSKGYVDNYIRGYYKITPEGIKRFHVKSKETEKKKKLNYPPKIITRRRNYDHWILWMVFNNNYCRWSDFLEEPLSINQSSLSKNLNLLINQTFIKKEDKEYRITRSGKVEYSNILQIYNLDRQSILNGETKRIEDVTKKTIAFFDKNNLNDADIQFRFLSNALKLDYSRVEDMTDEEDFDKILLFITMNHPDHYPEYITFEDFSDEYEIKKSKLEYYVDEIIDNNKYPTKFFKLGISADNYYYFQENERLEIMFRAIVEDYITKFTYLNKLFSKTVDITATLDHILDDVCNILFDSGLKDSLKEFLPEYINYLAYKIEAKKEFKAAEDKLEGIIWQDIPEIFQTQNAEAFKGQYEKQILKLEKEIKKNPENLDLYNSKLTTLVYYNQYDYALSLLDEMIAIFPERELDIKMKKASVLKSMKDLGAGLEIINELLETFSENNDLLNYKAYWLQYLGKREEALDIIQDLVKNNPDNAMYYDTYGEILMYFEDYEDAINAFKKTLDLAIDDWYIYQTYIKLGICYKELENFELARDSIIKGMELSKEKSFDVDSKQKWLAIADLYLKQVEIFL